MKYLIVVLIASVAFQVIQGAPRPQTSPHDLSWAFPMPDASAPPSNDNDDKPLRHIPGSSETYTEERINPFNPPDWFPDEHAPMPEVVRHGRGMVQACSYCHLSSGFGHPQSANLTGLSVEYLMEQLSDFKSGARVAPPMDSFAKDLTTEDALLASQWFTSLKPGPWVKIVETETSPKTFVLFTRLRLPREDGATEPLGNRIIEVPEDPALSKSYDPHAGFVAYVPIGSVAKGEKLVRAGGNGKTTPCAACHGPTLQGLDTAPKIAGRSPLYIVRQLYNIQTGVRRGEGAQLMKPVVESLDYDDMIAIAAYVSSRTP